MKFLLPTLFLVAALGFGCATKKPKTSFQSVPGASNVDPSLGHLATVTAAKVYAEKDKAEKAKHAKQPRQPKPPKQPKKPLPDKLIVTPESSATGKVMVYNEPGRFVVLNFPIGKMPQTGSRLFVYRKGLRTGEIKVTGPQRDDNTVADLVAGDALAGDEVRDK